MVRLLVKGVVLVYGRYLAFLTLLAVFGWMWLALLVWVRWRAVMVGAFTILAIGGVTVAIGFSTSFLAPKNLFYLDQLALVQRYVPKDAEVGAAQSGTLGFFRDRVVNLDGKVNNEPPRDR